jgi:hypothetical protein
VMAHTNIKIFKKLLFRNDCLVLTVKMCNVIQVLQNDDTAVKSQKFMLLFTCGIVHDLLKFMRPSKIFKHA